MYFIAMDIIEVQTISPGTSFFSYCNRHAQQIILSAYQYIEKKMTSWCKPTCSICIPCLVGHIKFCQKMEMCSRKKLFLQVASILGVEQVFSSPYRPKGNRHIENVHTFLKTCIWKHVSSQLAWNEIDDIACVMYNFVPYENLKDSAFSLMFRRDAYMLLVWLLNAKIKYLADDKILCSACSQRNICISHPSYYIV